LSGEGYYCTKNGKVKGVFTLTEHLVMFDPIKCSENEKFVKFTKIFTFVELKSTRLSSNYRHPGYCLLLKD